MKRGRKPICRYCKSKHTISKGYRPTVTLGKRSLRVCKDCGRKFTLGRLNVETPTSSITPKMTEMTPAAPAMQPISETPESQQNPVSTGP